MIAYHINPAGIPDIPAIIEIIEETWARTYSGILSWEQVTYMQAEIYNKTSLESQMKEGQAFFILHYQAKAAGFASISALPDNIYKVNKIYLKPAYQGLGLGKILLTYLENEIIKRGGKTLILNVNRFNHARIFYEKLGFTLLREEDIAIGPFWMNDYVLQKNIS